MNQTKKNVEFIKNSGINYFLQDSPRNWFESPAKKAKTQNNIQQNSKLEQLDEIKLDSTHKKDVTYHRIAKH